LDRDEDPARKSLTLDPPIPPIPGDGMHPGVWIHGVGLSVADDG
jgi:hypothetical protein